MFDKLNRTDGTFSRSDFVFDADRNHYTCPQGKLLVQFRRAYATPRSGITTDGTRLYREQVRLPGLHIQEAVLSEHAAAQSAALYWWPTPGRKSPGSCQGLMEFRPANRDRQDACHTARSYFALPNRIEVGLRGGLNG